MASTEIVLKFLLQQYSELRALVLVWDVPILYATRYKTCVISLMSFLSSIGLRYSGIERDFINFIIIKPYDLEFLYSRSFTCLHILYLICILLSLINVRYLVHYLFIDFVFSKYLEFVLISFVIISKKNKKLKETQ